MNLEFAKWNRLIQAMEARKRIVLHGVVLSSFYKSNLENYLRFCLEFYKKTDLLSPLLSLLSTLLERAYRENCLDSYFKSKGWDAASDGLAEKEEEFRSTWDFSDPISIRPVLKEQGFHLKTTISHNQTGLAVEISNNAVIPLESEEDLTEYLSRAKSYRNISEYYEDYPFDEEGKEIGLAFSLVQFKEIGIKPNLLRYDTPEGMHVFRVELPFGEKYESLIERIEKDEEVLPFPEYFIKEDEILEPWKLSTCKHCGRTVDDRIFFPVVPVDVPLRIVPDLPMDVGICAWCLSSYI
ncbi:hypothetical protein LEP1GSC047_2964 [Leptospira inadai serovar Lyme str. 10]|uniref:Uncharacterized protein n=2 Tax=Leptospira inadai serovar Lyme TaxID=293084 RepID=V6HCR4_9LEPT|nr:hypothetical protein [Leptospira inadai]EQA36713.1 hypothetical protein LEP1GSC047_2964 [Leptospira inadai serovar Lyme str. 10]PNV75558.1 hypothetical protein BES34_007950 [Leptospira inadai serovar Lyme]